MRAQILFLSSAMSVPFAGQLLFPVAGVKKCNLYQVVIEITRRKNSRRRTVCMQRTAVFNQ